MRVVLVKGESRYEALRVFIDEIAAAFEARGYEADIIDAPAKTDLHQAFAQAAARPCELVFSFNILGDYRDPDARSLGQVFGAPHVVQYVDYPLSHWVALDRTARDTALLMIDASHVETVAAIYGPDHFAHLAFSPHGAAGWAIALPQTAAQYVSGRAIPILFAGSFYEPQTPWWESQPPVIGQIFSRALEIAMAHESAPALAALDVALTEHGLDPAAADVGPFRKLAAHLHEQVRSHRRLAALTVAAELGLPVHVYGHGFEAQSGRFPGFRFGGEASLNEVLDLMRRSRVVLNINANFAAGSHERPLMAALAGAVAATDASSFYDAQFADEVAVYRWGALEEGLAAIGRLADDSEMLFDMAARGQQRVAKSHRWEARLDNILAAADAARARIVS